MNAQLSIYLLLIVTYASSLNIFHADWHVFKVTHGKQYEDQLEEEFRRKVFLENKNYVEEHNKAYEEGKVSFKMEMNRFGDLMAHEFKTIMSGFNATENFQNAEVNLNVANQYTNSLPNFVDWRDRGAVTNVKDQQQCAACWSFSTTGALESHLYLKTGKLISLSEQNLIDCSGGDYANTGCGGGNMNRAFLYIRDNGGLDTEVSYPYEARNARCRFMRDTVGGTDKGFINVPSGEWNLQNAVANIGPIAVSIDGGRRSLQFHKNGIYFDQYCSNNELHHAVLVVGYGTENGQDYWLIKNSWGSNWGENGYFKLARNRNNHCGISQISSYPIV